MRPDGNLGFFDGNESLILLDARTVGQGVWFAKIMCDTDHIRRVRSDAESGQWFPTRTAVSIWCGGFSCKGADLLP
jgi:hypothetical protein